MLDLKTYLEQKRLLIDQTLERVIPPAEEFPGSIHRAMRYCLLAGGKRLRPILALAAAEAVGGRADAVLKEACALELIHTYSLIHDDLPSMDNDDYRRGMPTTHNVFGEALAVLAGDALLTEAFRLLSGGCRNGTHRADTMLEIIQILSEAAGSRGLIGGQVADLESEGKVIEESILDYIHTRKTGRLITASVLLGAKLAGGSADEVACLEAYGRAIGHAFQITDDILDVSGSTERLGKPAGSDLKNNKATYLSICGMEEAQKRQKALYEDALNALKLFDDKAEPLRLIGQYIIERAT